MVVSGKRWCLACSAVHGMTGWQYDGMGSEAATFAAGMSGLGKVSHITQDCYTPIEGSKEKRSNYRTGTRIVIHTTACTRLRPTVDSDNPIIEHCPQRDSVPHPLSRANALMGTIRTCRKTD